MLIVCLVFLFLYASLKKMLHLDCMLWPMMKMQNASHAN